ncbi:MAG TPA: LLM class flavin-dependent oxidoreductase [Streptosporangiaceae bacterium]
MTAAGLDYVSDGRFVMGLGASGRQVIEGFHGLPYDEPLARTREIIEISGSRTSTYPAGRTRQRPPSPRNYWPRPPSSALKAMLPNGWRRCGPPASPLPGAHSPKWPGYGSQPLHRVSAARPGKYPARPPWPAHPGGAVRLGLQPR